MKLLLENWREYLLSEGAKDINDLPAGVKIKIDRTARGEWVISYAAQYKTGGFIEGPWEYAHMHSDGTFDTNPSTSASKPMGRVYIDNNLQRLNINSKCDGAFMVTSAEAQSGWGPLLYDIAMEWATIKGGGLMPDRYSVSDSARAIWDYYLKKRAPGKDVEAHQLDNPENELTSTDTDNCEQDSAMKTSDEGWLSGPAPAASGQETKWSDSALSKRYTKAPLRINALKSANPPKIIIKDE